MRTFNILGLSLALAACIFIGLYVADEGRYDLYNKNADRIFRITADVHINGGAITGIYSPSPMAATLKKDFPTIENAVRIRTFGRDVTVHVGDKQFLQSDAVRADSTLFAIFTFPMIEGDPNTALRQPNTVVLSASAAKRYFNRTDVVGQTLKLDEDTTLLTITGVIKDIPAQSHFHFQFIQSLQQRRQEWVNFFSSTYVLARPGVGPPDIDRMLTQIVENYVYPQIQRQLHNTPADLKKSGDYFRFYSVPLTRIHLHSNLPGEFEPNGNIRFVTLFIIIAILVLAVAVINFVNLSLAHSFRHLKTIGIKKLLGSGRARLIRQFLTDSLFQTALAMIIAIVITAVTLPLFNQLAAKSFTLSTLLNQNTIPIAVLITLLIGMIAGAGPAFTLTKAQPLRILRGQPATGTRTGKLRTALLVFQFSVAMMLIIGTGTIHSQMSYVRNSDLGYNRQQVLTIKNTRALGEEAWTFANEVRQLPGVLSATISGFTPGQMVISRGFLKSPTASITSTALLSDWQIDANYLPTLNMHLAAGRNFSPQLATDSNCILINETAARSLGYAHPLNERIYTMGDTVGFRIIGVVKDFNTGSLRKPIDPVVFRLARDNSGVILRLAANNIPTTMKAIRNKYIQLANGHPFTYSFLDDDFNSLYTADERTGTLYTVFSILAMIIAGLGMLGLVTAATEQRTKELGIRRVLGARLIHLITLLLKDYGLAITLAVAIALPTAGWIMNSWLQGFAYRTHLQPAIFIVSPLCALMLAVVIVSVKAMQAASLNPTVTLRAN
jgi:putative ABC transport system permease protein